MENLTSKQKVILIIVGIIVLSMFILYIRTQSRWLYTESSMEEEIENPIDKKIETDTQIGKIKVHITGAIKEEGVVELEEGDRIQDAIEKAGGLTDDANLLDVNLAYQLKDGQKIYIPRILDVENIETIETSNGEGIIVEDVEEVYKSNNEMININTATKSELEKLSGVGTETAQKIIEYRQNNGEFKKIEDIKNVSGIGEAKFENIKNNITV